MKRFLFIIFLIPLLANICYAQERGMKRPSNLTEMPEVVYRKGWALVIGIDKYPNLPSQFQLNYSVSDAESFANLLSSKFGFDKENITLLKNEEATKSKIKDKLSSFANPKMIDKDDCLLIYFSGHGQTVPLPRGAGEMGFLVPYDAKIGSLNQEPNPAEYMQYCIAMNELNEAAKTIPAKHIIFIIDACYSGLVLGSYRGFPSSIPGYLSKVAKAITQQMITAGGKGEVSEERTDLGHGVFTYKLLKGLEDELADGNNDGVITGTELSTYLTEAVRQMTDGKQNPRFGRYEEGEFLFIPQKSQPVTKTGKLAIQADPSDSIISIYSVGISPEKSYNAFASEIDLPVGTYNVIAEKNGYEKVSKEKVKVSAGSSTIVKLTLKQKPPEIATIDGKFLPQGTKVYINGSLVALPYKTSSGTYKIRFERDGYNPVESSEMLKAGQILSPNPTWVSIPKTSANGIFQVQVTPVDAKVSVTSLDDGRNYDIGQSVEINLPSGNYIVTAKKDGYISEIKEFNIATNKQTSMTIAMRAKQPEKALATIDGKYLPSSSRVFVDGSPVNLPHLIQSGTYSIRVERDGFKAYETKEKLSSGQVLSLNPSWSITEPIKSQRLIKQKKGISGFYALGASTIVPGLGQHLQGHKTRGFIYEGVVLATGVYALIATSQHHSTLDDYTEIRDKLLIASQSQMKITSDIKYLLTKQDDAYNKAKSAKSRASLAQVLFGVAWGINALDAGFLIKPSQSNNGLALEIRPISDGSMIIARSSF